MADLSSKKAASTVKVVGADLSSGSETNFASVTNAGGVHSNLRNHQGTELTYGHGNANNHTLRVAAELGLGGDQVTTTNRVPTTDLLNNAYVTAEKTSTATATIVRVGGSNLTNRKVIEIVNTGNVVVYVGASNVTSTGANRGRPINPKGNYNVALASNVDLYITSPSSTTYVVVEAG